VIVEVINVLGKAPLPVAAFGWALVINGFWALFWVAASARRGGRGEH
jgi:hypothetical protein